MKIILFSSNYDTIDEWLLRDNIKNIIVSYDLNALDIYLQELQSAIVIADYDSVSNDVNSLISSNNIPNNLIVLERIPEIATGKILISRGIKAYGNSRMLSVHYNQMIQAVNNSKVWTYPELTSALVKNTKVNILNTDSINLIKSRLSQKEQEVIHLVMNGMNNDAIASSLDITTRTVKAHISSIFNKLHVNDRISLVLLLK